MNLLQRECILFLKVHLFWKYPVLKTCWKQINILVNTNTQPVFTWCHGQLWNIKAVYVSYSPCMGPKWLSILINVLLMVTNWWMTRECWRIILLMATIAVRTVNMGCDVFVYRSMLFCKQYSCLESSSKVVVYNFIWINCSHCMLCLIVITSRIHGITVFYLILTLLFWTCSFVQH